MSTLRITLTRIVSYYVHYVWRLSYYPKLLMAATVGVLVSVYISRCVPSIRKVWHKWINRRTNRWTEHLHYTMFISRRGWREENYNFMILTSKHLAPRNVFLSDKLTQKNAVFSTSLERWNWIFIKIIFLYFINFF